MNKKNSIQTINEQSILQDYNIKEIYKKTHEVVFDSENESKKKYIVKRKLIESADDISTREKLDAMDKNYDRWNQERRQNALNFTIIFLGLFVIAIGGPIVVKKYT